MLTTSPIITSPSSSKNVSPRTFQYVPARMPQGSPSLPTSSRSISRQSAGLSQSPKTITISPTARTLMSSPTHMQPSLGGVGDRPASGLAPSGGSMPTQSSSSDDPQVLAVHRTPNAQRSHVDVQTTSKKPQSVKRRPNSPAVAEPSTAQDGGAQSSRNAGSQESARPAQRHRTLPAEPKVLPLAYENCAVGDMVILIAHMLSELIETNDGLALRSGSLTRFHSRTAPGISVLDYLNRLAHHATLSPPLLLSMVYYIDRLCALYPEFTINTLTVHRFLITAATVAAKGLSDSFWNNATYAKVGGIRVTELKLLELEFLYRVDWKIVPNPDVLVAYYKGLVERCPGYILQPSAQSSPSKNDRLEEPETTSPNGETTAVSADPATAPENADG